MATVTEHAPLPPETRSSRSLHVRNHGIRRHQDLQRHAVEDEGGRHVDSLDEAGFTFAAGVKTVKISIADDGGAAVWSGNLGANDTAS